MSKVKRVHAILGFNTTKIAVLIAGAMNIYTKMLAAASQFPSPLISLAAFLGLIEAVETAQAAVKARTLGAAATRDNAVKALHTGLTQMLTTVQVLADISTDHAAEIIAAAGMQVRATPHIIKEALTLTHGPSSGSVILRAYAALFTQGIKGGQHAAYSWQYSVDEKTWVGLPTTVIASTPITGLTPASTVYARVAVTVGKQPITPWSAVVSLIVQ